MRQEEATTAARGRGSEKKGWGKKGSKVPERQGQGKAVLLRGTGRAQQGGSGGEREGWWRVPLGLQTQQ